MTDDKIKKIPPGYKQTELSVIPEDWEVKKLGEVAQLYQPETISQKVLTTSGYPVFGANGFIGYYHKYNHEKWQVIVTCRGSTSGTVNKTPNKCWITGNAMVINVDNFEKEINKNYLYFLLYSQNLQKLISGSGQPQITRFPLNNYSIPLPPLPEQQAIARVLSDVDELIESLSKLIEKKKNIKKGAMQELLTGKRRLPGFGVGRGYKQTELSVIPEDWEVKKLGEVCLIEKGKGLSKSKTSQNGKYECILYGELFTIYKEYSVKVFSRTSFFEGVPSKTGDVLLPGSTTTTGIDLAKATAILKDNILIGGDINILRSKGKYYDSIYLAFLLTHICKYEIAQKTKGITIHHLHGSDLIDLSIFLPPLPEQQAIARVLSDMDEEIEALEKKKAKYENLKKAMMQVLLTGKIRLKNFTKV